VAPILTLFVGGNHESSGFMAELPNGGWVAPNIYFMGYSSVSRGDIGPRNSTLFVAGCSIRWSPNCWAFRHLQIQ
jgi:hypothetical protein